MNPILCTEPMELVHIDYVGMEVTGSQEPSTIDPYNRQICGQSVRSIAGFPKNRTGLRRKRGPEAKTVVRQ